MRAWLAGTLREIATTLEPSPPPFHGPMSRSQPPRTDGQRSQPLPTPPQPLAPALAATASSTFPHARRPRRKDSTFIGFLGSAPPMPTGGLWSLARREPHVMFPRPSGQRAAPLRAATFP